MPAKVRTTGDTPSEIVVKAASDTHIVKDSIGRSITVQKPSPLLRFRVMKMLGADNSKNEPVLGYAMLACCVRAIDGVAENVPNSERQIETMIERLGDEGLSAVGNAMVENFGLGSEAVDEECVKN